ncbi:MAG: hypothetical protein HRU19_29935 [Pseudobacteriovorax sp.]|nr:hypothetical protein [Pseudobacteriovorax sp.]
MREIVFPRGWAPMELWIARLEISDDYKAQELEQRVMEMTKLVQGCIKEINRGGKYHQVFHKRIIADVLVRDGVMKELYEENEVPMLERVGERR